MRAATVSSFFAVTLCSTSVFAGEVKPMAPEDFLASVVGKTVHYEVDGEHYGIERFYGKGRATWQFPGATCEDGLYWPAETENDICFRYGTTSCWTVFKDDDNRMAAVSQDGFSVTISRIDDSPLKCDGNPIS